MNRLRWWLARKLAPEPIIRRPSRTMMEVLSGPDSWAIIRDGGKWIFLKLEKARVRRFNKKEIDATTFGDRGEVRLLGWSRVYLTAKLWGPK